MLGLINLYITKEFVLYFLSCIISLVAVALTFVVLSELGSLSEPDGGAKFFAAILESVPLLVELILPISVLLGTILTFTSLSKTSETIAMQAAGVSVVQMLRPVLLIGVLIAIGSYFNQSYLAPWWGADKKLSFAAPKEVQTIWRYYQGQLYFFSQLHRQTHYAGLMGVVHFTPTHQVGAMSQIYHVSQDGADWTSGKGKKISFDQDQVKFENLTPREIAQGTIPVAFNPELPHPKYTTFWTLIEAIHNKAQGAVSYSDDLFALFQKIAGLISIFTMMLLALPFSLFTGRSANLRSGIVIAIVLGFVYWLVDQVFASLFEAGALPAWLAAFAANGLFLGLAFIFFRQRLQ